MLPESFHFLRPAWLLALVPAAVVVWAASRSAMQSSAWRRLVDQHLLSHLLLDGEEGTRRWPLTALGAALAAASLALAGPTWERVPQPTYTSLEPTVAVVDLSPAMNVDDVKPSRLARARFKLHDVLEQTKGGQVGLVLYADDAFVAAPLTDDGRVIEEMIPSLTPNLMPGRGSRAERGIAQASALLDQAGAPSGRIVLLTASPGDDRPAALAAAREAAAHGRTLQVIAIGTEEGTPLRDRLGRPVKDASGSAVTAKLDRPALDALAASGNGRLTIASIDDADVKSLLAERSASSPFVRSSDAKVQADVWRDAGVWIVAIPLLLAPLGFRRGWLVVFALLALTLPARRADASSWDDLWKTRDQQGEAALHAGQAAAAAELFQALAWKAAAQYEGGNFADAVKSYQGLDGATNKYNLGNSLAKAGQLQPALEAYDRALAEQPDDADAKFNRDLVKRLLDEQRKQQEQQKQQQQSGQSKGQPQQGGEGQKDQQSPQDGQAQNGQGGDGSPQDQQAQAQQEHSDGSGSSSNSSGEPKNDEQAKAGSEQKQDGTGEDSSFAQQANAGQEQEKQSDGAAQQAQADRSEQAGADAQEQQAKADGDEQQAKADANQEKPGAEQRAPGGASDSGDKQQTAGRARAEEHAQAKADKTLAEQMNQALQGDAPQPQQAASGSAAAHRAPTEEEQAREQKLRRIHDDPAGLLRARIQRHFAEQQLSKQEGVTTW